MIYAITANASFSLQCADVAGFRDGLNVALQIQCYPAENIVLRSVLFTFTEPRPESVETLSFGPGLTLMREIEVRSSFPPGKAMARLAETPFSAGAIADIFATLAGNNPYLFIRHGAATYSFRSSDFRAAMGTFARLCRV